MLDKLAEITNRSEQNDVDEFLKMAFNHEIPLPKIPVTIVANEDVSCKRNKNYVESKFEMER